MPQTLDVIQAAVTSYQEGKKTIDEVILESVIEARNACEINGNQSQECAVAWDIVEELQAERSHRKQATKIQTSLDHYCYLHPEAAECRVYDV
ncbi:Calvin cycle protein CP12 [Calothrix sp. UHCC 0171]|uniref:Calvin cycle protein CP12 n=1 Tax=Calothrix sp. UHCC 0171 TaxID=3110245 RepID=UPI002B20993D|nr:Calvin cycle protein CP12 [Calothrix sp. UHCC 0171]MEA5571149.1 Calvin cycle protein CP12 [Calothrix sp. UHCC 0171]